MRVKLAAIAKDEAAYLPEWIHHHLAMGFDEIEVLVNYTEDNSVAILEKISKNHSVKYRVIDDSIIDESGNFQISAYNDVFKNCDSNIDFLMFLDIDEYWFDSEMKLNIKDCINHLNNPDVIAFQWGIKIESNESFSLAIENTLHLLPAKFLKTIFKVSDKIQKIYPHKVDIASGLYLFSNGDEITVSNKAILEDNYHNLDRFFIIHRVYRSQMEYVSLLGRGRPRHYDTEAKNVKLKENRYGYITEHKDVQKLTLLNNFEDNYKSDFNQFIQSNDITHDINQAKVFIINRFYSVLDIMSDLPRSNKPLIKQLTNGLDIPQVKSCLDRLKYKWELEDKLSTTANTLRNLAIQNEDAHPLLAFNIMSLAQSIRPDGPLINKKIKEYKEKLEQ